MNLLLIDLKLVAWALCADPEALKPKMSGFRISHRFVDLLRSLVPFADDVA